MIGHPARDQTSSYDAWRAMVFQGIAQSLSQFPLLRSLPALMPHFMSYKDFLQEVRQSLSGKQPRRVRASTAPYVCAERLRCIGACKHGTRRLCRTP